MKKIRIILTECFKCGKRYESHFRASPCCRSIMMKVDEKGERTTITFLGSFFPPDPVPAQPPANRYNVPKEEDRPGS